MLLLFRAMGVSWNRSVAVRNATILSLSSYHRNCFRNYNFITISIIIIVIAIAIIIITITITITIIITLSSSSSSQTYPHVQLIVLSEFAGNNSNSFIAVRVTVQLTKSQQRIHPLVPACTPFFVLVRCYLPIPFTTMNCIRQLTAKHIARYANRPVTALIEDSSS